MLKFCISDFLILLTNKIWLLIILVLSLHYYFKFNTIMIKYITGKLTENPSYLKKGDNWLASRFGCSPKTVRRIKGQLKHVKQAYLASL